MTQEGPWKPGLDTTGFSPLQHFKGVLDHYEYIDSQGTRGNTYRSIQFSFKDVEVIKSTEPYPFPTAEMRISYSTRTGTKWDAWAKSLRKLAPDAIDPDVLLGKVQEWTLVPTQRRAPLNDDAGQPQLNEDGSAVWGDIMEDMWHVMAVDGLGSAQEADEAFNAHLLGLADSKNDKDFYAAALGDERVRKNTPVVTAITSRTLLDTLISAGKLTRDNEGILHKKA